MKKLFWILAALLIARLFVPVNAHAAEVPSVIAGENLVDGKPVSFTLGEGTYAIAFVSSICPCSASHVTELKSLAKDYPDVTFIEIHSNIDEKHDQASQYFKTTGLPVVVQDDNNKLADALGAFKTPHSYVVQNRKIVYAGGVTDHQTFTPSGRRYLREALEDLKQHRPVKTATTRTLGCAIPRG